MGDVRRGQWWRDRIGLELRVMVVAENYAMCRRKGAAPFVEPVKNFAHFTKLAIPAKEPT